MSLKKIKTRLTSVKNTQQMTKAMKMVSAARLRSAQSRILNLRDYARTLREVMRDVCLSRQVSHPFLEKPKEMKNILIAMVTSDRGLCGGFNGNVCRFTERFLRESDYEKMDLFFIGRKGRDYFKFRGVKGIGTILNLVKDISYPFSARIARNLMEHILAGEYEGVFIIYNEFKNVLTTRVIKEQFLPFDVLGVGSSEKKTLQKENLSQNLLFEVPPEKMLESLLQRYFSVQIYRGLCESVAAEQGSRMTAMENATKNAGEVISSLTLTYNKLRQSAITTELTEIVGGVEAMKG